MISNIKKMKDFTVIRKYGQLRWSPHHLNNDRTKCLFCQKKAEENNDVVSPTPAIITNEMKEYVNNACDGHKITEMAQVLEINVSTLKNYLSRNNIRF